MSESSWIDVGSSEELAAQSVQEVRAGKRRIALSCRDGRFGAISGVCNHVGGPLGRGRLDGDFVVCPWHYYKFHWQTGEGEPGYEADRVPSHGVKVEGGRVLVTEAPSRSAGACRMNRIRWRASRNASRDRYACSAFRPRR
jgi:nitrite reductase/ring-hydroxylating ferredoxin subunit